MYINIFFFIAFMSFILLFFLFSGILKLKDDKDYNNSYDINNLDNLRTKIIFDEKILTEDEIKIIDNRIKKDEIIKEGFGLFNVIANNYSNTTLFNVKNLIEPEYYDNLLKNQKKLYETNRRRILKNIEFVDGGIVSITRLDKVEKIKLSLTLKLVDCTIEELKYLEFDSNLQPRLIETFEVDIVRYKNKIITNCKNCGAPISDKKEDVCLYCGSKKDVEVLKCKIENIKLHRKEQN